MSVRKTTFNLPAVARVLRAWRRRRKLTQRELAARTGLSPVTLRAFERGEITPDQDDRRRICAALDVVPGDFDQEVFWIEKREGFAGEGPHERSQAVTLAPGFGDLLTGLLPPGRKLLVHLLTCSDCRQEIVPDLLSEQLPGLVPDPDEWGVPREPQADDAEEPAAALAELLGCLPEERAALLAEERFHEISLLELLLRTSREGQLDNPELAEHLASLAGQLAGLIPDIADRERQAAFLTRAAVLEANARRLAGNREEADRPFARAPFYAAPPAEQALFQRALALIRWEQGRFGEADNLFTQASRNFVGARLLTEEGATLILLGLFEAERGLFPLAAFHLLGGLAAVDGRERPWLFVRGGLALALSMVEQGGKPHAVELLNRLRKLYPQVQDPSETIRLYWLEGQLRARLGDVTQARELLVSVRSKYVTQLQLHEAVLSSLDLAAVPAAGRKPEESRRLSDELEEYFAGAQGLGEILKALRLQGATPLQVADSTEGDHSFRRKTTTWSERSDG